MYNMLFENTVFSLFKMSFSQQRIVLQNAQGITILLLMNEAKCEGSSEGSVVRLYQYLTRNNMESKLDS